MIAALTLAVALLTSSGVYLLLSKRVFSIILGFSLLAHAAHLVMLAGGGLHPRPPIVTEAVSRDSLADPLPQAFVLTAIVIAMAVTLYQLAVFAASARRLKSKELLTPMADDSGRGDIEIDLELRGQEEAPR